MNLEHPRQMVWQGHRGRLQKLFFRQPRTGDTRGVNIRSPMLHDQLARRMCLGCVAAYRYLDPQT